MNVQPLTVDSAAAQPLAKVFGHYASQLVDDVSDDVLLKIKPYVLDTLAVMVAGSTAPSSQVMLAAVARFAPTPSATVAGMGRYTDASHAALLNGAFAHALELDDDHRVAVLHPGAVIVPAALAACELSQSSGRVFLAAVLAGYEMTCRLGLAYRGSHFEHGFHPTAIFGVFGAALAAAVGMRLGPVATTHALGIAGTQASGFTLGGRRNRAFWQPAWPTLALLDQKPFLKGRVVFFVQWVMAKPSISPLSTQTYPTPFMA